MGKAGGVTDGPETDTTATFVPRVSKCLKTFGEVHRAEVTDFAILKESNLIWKMELEN